MYLEEIVQNKSRRRLAYANLGGDTSGMSDKIPALLESTHGAMIILEMLKSLEKATQLVTQEQWNELTKRYDTRIIEAGFDTRKDIVLRLPEEVYRVVARIAHDGAIGTIPNPGLFNPESIPEWTASFRIGHFTIRRIYKS